MPVEPPAPSQRSWIEQPPSRFVIVFVPISVPSGMRTSQRPTQKSNAARLGNAFARIHARAHVAVHALEAAELAIPVELRRALDERERAQAAVIGGVERRERLVVAAEQREIARALEIDHRLGRVRRARVLERRERVVVALQLALRLRDAQQAQAILGVRGENLAVLGDRVVPTALLERELGGIRNGRRRLAFLAHRALRPRATVAANTMIRSPDRISNRLRSRHGPSFAPRAQAAVHRGDPPLRTHTYATLWPLADEPLERLL